VRVALDTNVLVYAERVNGEELYAAALAFVGRLPRHSAVLPAQVLGELFNVLVRKAGWSKDAARTAVLKWQNAFPVIETSRTVMLAAVDLAADHDFSIWDAIVMSAAAESGCRLLLSQDMQDGFTWNGVRVTNPFSSSPHPLLEALLAGPPQ
jgi:predicted nucleic acid-binding protein